MFIVFQFLMKKTIH